MKGKMGCSKCGMMKCSCGGKVGKMMGGGAVEKMKSGGKPSKKKSRSPVTVNTGLGDRGRAKIRQRKTLPQSQKSMRTKARFTAFARNMMGGGGKLLKMLSPAAALGSSLKSGKPEGLMAIMPIGAMMKQGNKPAASGSNKTVRGAKTMASGGRINGAAKRGHTKGKMC
jgi:hypothetical protein